MRNIKSWIGNILARPVVRRYQKQCPKEGCTARALLLYKTAPFDLRRFRKSFHTNQWEAVEIANILNQKGYIVDVVDRGNTGFQVKEDYDLFIGNGLDSAYLPIAKRLPEKTVRIFYATGANPEVRNEAIKTRQRALEQRRGVSVNPIRLKNVDIEASMRHTDALFCLGNKSYMMASYKRFRKPMYQIIPSTVSSLEKASGERRDPNKFLYFAGHGLLHKGLDILLEAFSQDSELQLFICAPMVQKDFIRVYQRELYEQNNIHVIGMISTKSNIFHQLTEECAYVILPSCSESAGVSVLTCMKRGLIPITTPETGVDAEDSGFELKEMDPDSVLKQLQHAASLDSNELEIRSQKAYNVSQKYTRERFSESFAFALDELMSK